MKRWFGLPLLTGLLLLCGVAAHAATPAGVVPFTTFSAERKAVLEVLPCKWVSHDGRDGIRRNDSRYDFLCKGGAWATVSLMMDTAQGWQDGVGRVRLLFREWPAEVHPGGGEAYVAQQFLQHVANRFVPADLAERVQAGFWENRRRHWRGAGVRIDFSIEDFGNHVVRRLEITGIDRALGNAARPAARTGGPVPTVPAQVNVAPAPTVAPTVAPVVPAPAPAIPPQEEEKGVVESLREWWRGPEEPARVQTMEMPEVQEPLVFEAEPAPESLEKPEAPPPVREDLVPEGEDMSRARGAAPAAFEAYNRAEELTRQFEVRSLDDPNANAKIFAAGEEAPKTAGEETGLLVAPESQEAPALAPVATPMGAVSGTVRAVTLEPMPKDAGLRKPEDAPPVRAEAPAPAAEDPRFLPERSLPQLKYIPKAKPVNAPDEVIRFEDEKSAL